MRLPAISRSVVIILACARGRRRRFFLRACRSVRDAKRNALRAVAVSATVVVDVSLFGSNMVD